MNPLAAAGAPTPEVVAWISPQNTYRTFAAVIVDLATVRAAFPDRTVRVAIPTIYGRYFQGQMERPTYRLLGDELCPSDLAGYAALRRRFEDAGYPCDGWSVPRGNTGNDYNEGTMHGDVAELFERFYLNTEWGWDGFWTKPSDVGAANGFLGGFWSAAPIRLDGNVGMTMVTNSMLTSASDDFLKAWIGGTNFDALEAYYPGDPNLDPSLSLNIWAGVLGRLRVPAGNRPSYLMVAQNIVAYVQGADPVHLWTLQSVQSQCLAIIAANQPNPEPPTPAPDYRVALASVTSPTGEIVPALDAAMKLTNVKAMRAAVASSRNRLVAVYNEFKP